MVQSTGNLSISVFFPAYNDGGTIASLILLANQMLASLTDDYEIVVVEDGSHDYTLQVLEELQKTLPALRIIKHPENLGYGAALKTGFAQCTKELIFYTDGDGQYDVREMKLLLEQLTKGVDWVNGYKISRKDPLRRKIIGRIYHSIVSLMFGISLKDIDCDFRLIRRSVFNKVQLSYDSGVICVEMMKKFQTAGFTVREVPVSHYFRAYGKSQFFNFRRVFQVGIDLMKLWYVLMILPNISCLPPVSVRQPTALKEKV